MEAGFFSFKTARFRSRLSTVESRNGRKSGGKTAALHKGPPHRKNGH
jgi:hypothetical protein